jgi:hypothetical protein
VEEEKLWAACFNSLGTMEEKEQGEKMEGREKWSRKREEKRNLSAKKRKRKENREMRK